MVVSVLADKEITRVVINSLTPYFWMVDPHHTVTVGIYVWESNHSKVSQDFAHTNMV